MFDDLNDLYQQVILDHCKKPRNFHEMPRRPVVPRRAITRCAAINSNSFSHWMATRSGHQLRWIGLLHLEGVGIVADGIRQRQNQGRRGKMFGEVRDMVTTGKMAEDVGKLAVFAGVYKYPARVKCAILARTR